MAQTRAPAPAAPAKEEETPFWAVSRPKGGPGAQMAPVPAFPIPTPADKPPVAKMKVPPGFKVEVFASDVLDARGLRQGDKGTVFVRADGESPRPRARRLTRRAQPMRSFSITLGSGSRPRPGPCGTAMRPFLG